MLFFAATGLGSFLATVIHPAPSRRWGRYAAANGALAFAARRSSCAASGLQLPVMVLCGFLLGAAGQVVKLCADTAMQIDVDDALRGHVFTVQDSLFWMSFIVAIDVGGDGDSRRRPRSPRWSSPGSAVYLVGLAAHASVGRRAQPPG